MTERSSGPSDWEDPSPLVSLIDAGNAAQRGLEKRLSSLRLSPAQQRILAAVYVAKEPLAPTMLAAILLQETHSVSGLLNRLEERGLITREHDKKDRRVVWVGLTDAGRRTAEESIRIHEETATEYARIFGGAKGPRLTALLEGVRDTGFRIAGVSEEARREALRRLGTTS